MPVAPTYNRQFNFTNYQAVNPATPLPATPLDNELSSVKVTLDALNANLQLIQRSDGQLANASVGPQQLQPSILAGMSPPTQWSGSNVSYQVGSTVFSGLLFYVCNTANISSTSNPPATFAAWTLLADFSGVTIPAGSITSAAFAPGAVNSAALGANLALSASPSVGDNSTAIATTAYVTGQVSAMLTGFPNRLINGDMRIDQRNNGASGTPITTKYFLDRWQYFGTQSGKVTCGRNLGPPGTLAPGFPYCFGFASSSAYTPLTGDTFGFSQPVEADNVSDLRWGTVNAQPVTLSFWALSSLTGGFSGAIRNAANTRSYPFTYTIPVANAWTRIVVAIPGDTGGTWVLSGNGGALSVSFELGGNTTFRAAAGAWTAGNFTGVTGAVSIVATLNATFYATGVKLETGSIDTPWVSQSLGRSLADCQRYYQAFGAVTCSGVSLNGGVQNYPLLLPVTMRAVPTATGTGTGGSGYSGVTFTPKVASIVYSVATSASGFAVDVTSTLEAEL